MDKTYADQKKVDMTSYYFPKQEIDFKDFGVESSLISNSTPDYDYKVYQ